VSEYHAPVASVRFSPEPWLVGPGVACVLAAVVGGGSKAFGVEFPVVESPLRQVGLAGIDVALVVAGTRPDRRAATAPELQLVARMADLIDRLLAHPRRDEVFAVVDVAGARRPTRCRTIGRPGPGVART
jgi:hypothetical protein